MTILVAPAAAEISVLIKPKSRKRVGFCSLVSVVVDEGNGEFVELA
jgi:hypothetical protein